MGNYARVDLTTSGGGGGRTVGGLMGYIVGTSAQRNYVAGSIKVNGTDNHVGGVYGASASSGRVSTTVIDLDVEGGYLIDGDSSKPGCWDFDVSRGNTKFYLTRETTNRRLQASDSANDGYAQKFVDIDRAEVPAYLEQIGITLAAQPTSPLEEGEVAKLAQVVDVPDYDESTRIGYANAAKFMPLASAGEIVEAGARLAADGRFGNVAVRSVTPLDAQGRLVDHVVDGDSVKSVLVNFADGTATRYGVSVASDRDPLSFRVESIAGGITYVPEHARGDFDAAAIERDCVPASFRDKVEGDRQQAASEMTQATATADDEFLHSAEYKSFLGVSDDAAIRNMYLDVPFKRALQTAEVDKVELKGKAKTGWLSLKVGASFKLSAKAKELSKKLKVKNWRSLRYESSNPKVATVGKKGKVTAHRSGTATVWVYAQNGKAAKLKVTVR